MKQALALLGAALAALVVGAGLASQALALPELLGQSAGAEYSTKNTTENPGWESTKEEKIVCKGFSGQGVQENDMLGTFHSGFTLCTSSGFSCNSNGDSTGAVLMLGTKHYVLYKLGTGSELGVAVLFLPEELTLKCTALVTYKIRGTFLCAISEPLTSSTTHTFTCSGTKGVPALKTWWNDSGEPQEAKLEISKNGGSFVEAELFGSGSITFGTAVAFMNE